MATTTAATELQPLAYSIPDACRVTTCGKTKIYQLISEGKLASTTIGKRRVILADSLRRLIAEGC